MRIYDLVCGKEKLPDEYTVRCDGKIISQGSDSSVVMKYMALNIGPGHKATLRRNGKLVARKRG